jgi:hypothetical protein
MLNNTSKPFQVWDSWTTDSRKMHAPSVNHRMRGDSCKHWVIGIKIWIETEAAENMWLVICIMQTAKCWSSSSAANDSYIE